MKVIKWSRLKAALESADHRGFCLSCGAEASGVEPDACEYECKVCGEMTVYGAEEVLLVGQHTAS